MLIDEPKALEVNPILAIIGAASKNGPAERVVRGIYTIPHFGGSAFLEDYEQYDIKDLSGSSYGVCDDYTQILQAYPELSISSRQFVVTLTPVLKANQESSGGWRWHKWGPYIGTHTITTEYLYDEVEIDRVFVYQIYERKETAS